MLANDEFLGLGGFGRCLFLLELCVCLFRESLGDVCSLVLEIMKESKLMIIRGLSQHKSARRHRVSAICIIPTRRLLTADPSFILKAGDASFFPKLKSMIMVAGLDGAAHSDT